MSVATIQLHKAAIAAIHRCTGHEDPTLHEGVKRVMGGISRSREKAQRQAKPLTAETLAAVRATTTGRRRTRGDTPRSKINKLPGHQRPGAPSSTTRAGTRITHPNAG